MNAVLKQHIISILSKHYMRSNPLTVYLSYKFQFLKNLGIYSCLFHA